MKRDYGKIKEMKVQKLHKVEGYKRLNKKVVTTFLVSTVLAVAAGFVGILSANAAYRSYQRNVGQLTQFDRILYWKDGKRCLEDSSEENKQVTPAATSLPVCYNAIPQKYALGYINATKYIERANRKIKTNNKKGLGNGEGVASFKAGGAMSHPGGKGYVYYVDFFDGASYMGDLYDLRVYPQAVPGCGSAYVHANGGKSLIEHWHDGGACVMSEWHFYPRNTLKALDQLYYSPEQDWVESPSEDYPCEHSEPIYGTDPKTGKRITVGKTCYYDQNAYRDPNDFSKILYSGVFRDGRYGPVKYTAATMEEYLKQQEESIQLLGIEDTGTFYGTVAFKDIDTWGGERYDPVRGGVTVFTTYNSIERAKTEKNKTWPNILCPDNGTEQICRYSWGGGKESSPANMESWMWFNFTSNYNAPFSLVYSGGGHGSPIESSTFTVAHVIKDDMSEIPEAVVTAVQEFNNDYEKTYGRPLSDDEFFKKQADVEPDEVLRLFQIYQYADYDPYTINELLKELLEEEGADLKWYTCEEMREDCLVPRDPDHNGGAKEVGGTLYINGYDFVSGDRVYYASINDIWGVEFDPTCYSDNTKDSTFNVEVKNEN